MKNYNPIKELVKLREMIADVDCDDRELNARFWCFKNDVEFLAVDNTGFIGYRKSMDCNAYGVITNYTKSLDALYECIPDGYTIEIQQHTSNYQFLCLLKHKTLSRTIYTGYLPTIHLALMDAVAQAIDYDNFMKESE